METKVLRSAIETYPIIILILTQMIQRLLATKPECSFMFVTVCSVRNTKFSQQCVETPKFLSLHEYFSNSTKGKERKGTLFKCLVVLALEC